MSSTQQQNTQKQAFWFLIVGALAALVHFIVLICCVQLFAILPVWANVIAFFIAFIVSFTGHFSLTFNNPNTQQSWLKSLPKWFASSIAGFALNQTLFMLGLYWLGNNWYALIWFIVTGLVTVMTFALGKLWAFKH